MQEPEMVDYSKEAALSRHMGMESHSNSQMLKQHTLYILTGSNKISPWHREGQEDKRPTPNQAILCNWYLLGKEKTVFSDGIIRYINYTAEQVTWPGVVGLHKLGSLFFSVCVYFCYGVFIVWTFAFTLFFYFERKNMMGREVSRDLGGAWKEAGIWLEIYAKFLEKICNEDKVVSVRAGGAEVPLSTNMQIMQISTILSNIYNF